MCCKEILQTSGNSLPTHLQAIMQPGGRWQTPRLPHRLNPSSTSDNLLHACGLMLVASCSARNGQGAYACVQGDERSMLYQEMMWRQGTVLCDTVHTKKRLQKPV